LTRVDIHAHIYPKSYLHLLESCGLILNDIDGTKFILEQSSKSGHRIRVFEEMWNLEQRLKVMDKLSVNIEVLSIGNPWVSYFPKEKSKASARVLNTELSEISKRFPKRFAAMGVIPFSSVNDAIDEIEFAVDELELKGFMTGTHSEGKPIFSEEFYPIFGELERRDIPLFIHPLVRENVVQLYDRLLIVGVLFPNETSIAATGFVTHGVIDKFPNLRIILAHLGGNIPFSIGRIERAVKTNPTSSMLKKNTFEYFKQFYLDSISYFSPAIEYTCKLWGADKIMLGTDSPWHWSENYEKVIQPIEDSDCSIKDKQLILGDNAVKLFKLG
jgi:predicted TIM-barrel fold metal-dependent hydrolase